MEIEEGQGEKTGVELMPEKPVVIIGAGPAGLTAAHELTRRGRPLFVIEKADKVGGIARTETYRGYHFDIGGHRFLTKFQEVQRLWEEILGDDLKRVPRLSRIYFNGRFFSYPLEFLSTLLNLGLLESLLILLSYCRVQIRPLLEERSFEQWVINRFGDRLYRTFFKTYTEKVWGIPCDSIQADWAAQRIKGLSLVAAVTNALFGTQQSKTLVDEFYYPVKGPGMMWERFQGLIESEGGKVLLNSESIGLRHENGRISNVVYRSQEGRREIATDHVISTMPITKLISILEPQAPDHVVEAGRRLHYRSFTIVALIVDKAFLFPDQWIYIHSPEVKVGRIQNFKNWSPAMVPDSEKTSIGMEYFCTVGDEIWNMTDAKLIELASGELESLGLAGADDVQDGIVVRQPGAYPIYDQNYGENLEVIRRFFEIFENLQTVGRNGMHRYNNMDHSMITGILAVKNMYGQQHDLWSVNEEDEYLEEDRRAKEATTRILSRTFARMDPFAFSLSTGITAGLLIFLATMLLVIKGGEIVGPNLRLLSQYFIGYTVTFKGAFIAFGYSFFWGFLFGWLFAYLRNLFLAFFIYRARKKAELVSLKDFFDHV
jgi:protoporphyrinogen oxidase